MARTKLVQLLDGHRPVPGADEAIQFALDGTRYEIDLNRAHAEDLRSVLGDLREVCPQGRRWTGRSGGRRRGGTGVADGDQIRAIRDWAKQVGHKVSERGRIPAKIKQAYEEAQRR